MVSNSISEEMLKLHFPVIDFIDFVFMTPQSFIFLEVEKGVDCTIVIEVSCCFECLYKVSPKPSVLQAWEVQFFKSLFIWEMFDLVDSFCK